jgi:2-methylcitrate dehydratase
VATVLERIAALAQGVDVRDLPDEVVHEAGRRLLDALGCMLGGAPAEPVRAVAAAVGGTTGPATLVGDRLRAGPADAALVNCTALRYLDYMDGHPGPYSCHPALVIPAILAVAEARHSSGAEVVRAIAVGYEIDIRAQLGSGDPDITRHGWSGSTNLGLAVPAAIGGVLGLSATQLAHALAIATVHAPALNASGRGDMAQSKSCVDGMVAQSAVTAALMAERGMTGKLSAYEGEDGFVGGVARGYDGDVLLGPIERLRILDVYTKRFNAVKCAQSATASALRIRERIGGWEQIDRIVLRLAERDARNQAKDLAARRRPGNRDTANHSVRYCLAAALVHGRLTAEQFGVEARADERVRALIDRITVEPDPALTPHWPRANPATVEVRTRSGETVADTTVHFPGHPDNPVSDADLEDKFRSLAEPVLGARRPAAVVDAVRDLIRLRDVSTLMALVRSGP